MILFVAPLVFCLAGVASDYAADPYRNEVNSPLPQNIQNFEAGQVDPSPAQSEHWAQNKESPFGNAKSAQNENVKAPSNYGHKINYKYGTPGDANADQPTLVYASVPNSAKQYENPKSGFSHYPNTAIKANVTNAANTPYQTNMNVGNPAEVKNFANLENLPDAINTGKTASQFETTKYGTENIPLNFNYPNKLDNTAKSNQFDNFNNLANQFQSQKQGLAENLNVAKQYKNLRTPIEANEHFGDDQQDHSLDTNNDDTRRSNKRQDSNTKRKNEYNGKGFKENCHLANQINDRDEESRRSQELYWFINHKLNEDYEEKSRKGLLKDNKAINLVHKNSPKTDKDFDDQLFQNEFEVYSPPSRNPNYYKGTKNQGANKGNTQVSNSKKIIENANPTNFDDNFDDKGQSTFSQNVKQQSVQPKIKEYTQTVKKPRKLQQIISQADHENYDEQEDQNMDVGKDNKVPKNNQMVNKNSQTSKENKNSPRSQVLQKAANSSSKQYQHQSKAGSSENVEDVYNPDEYKSEEDYVKDYKDDFSDLQSRRSYNLPQVIHEPQSTFKNNQDLKDADCDSKEAPNQLAQNQNDQNREAEEVDVTAKSGRRQKVLIGEHTRVCYACSSTSNPTCLKPNKQTTVKYCHRGHDSCVTKVFKANGIDILTRDCGTSCNDNIIPGVTPKYAKCSVCHSDLCNGAFSLNGQNVFYICALVVVTITKYFV